MKNKTLILSLIAVLVVGGGALAFLSMNKDDSKDTNTSQTSDSASQNRSTTGLETSDNPLGIDLEAQKGPYRMSIESTSEAGEVSILIFDVDKDGDMKTTVASGADQVAMIFTDNILYTQNPEDGSWIKLSTGSTDALEGALTQDDIAEFKNNNFVKTGTAACTAGICDVYEGTDEASGEKQIAKIDRKTNRISDIESTIDGRKSTFSFDYSIDISDITAPEGATELNIPDLPL